MENGNGSTYDPTTYLSYRTLFFEGGVFFNTAEDEADLVEQNRLYRHAMRSYIQAIRVLRRDTQREVDLASERYAQLVDSSRESLKKVDRAAIFRVGSDG